MGLFDFLSLAALLGTLFLFTVIASEIFKRWLKHKEEMAKVLSQETAERAAHYAAKVEKLEQRMGVLERILTDRSTHLGEEIERLRDTPIN